MKRFILPLAALLLASCGAKTSTTDDVEQKIDKLLSQMTLEEKVAMCHAQSKFSSPGVPRLGIPELWYSDGPHGVRGEINWDNWGYAGWTNDSCTAFPALTALASTFNPELSYEYGVAIGEEARYRKKDVLLGPGVNIYRTPLNGRNFEYMGEDPYLASIMVVPYIKGVQTNGVAASVKHFALNNQEEYRGNINVEISDRALYEIYLPAFKAAVIDGGSWTVMGAYNQIRGQHCCHNDMLLNKILKDEWKFDGAVVTDWGAVHDAKQAAMNGLDIEMGTWTNGLTSSQAFAYDNYFLAKPFLELIRKGEVPESVLNDKVRRILRLMLRTNMNEKKPYGALVNEAHSHTALNIAREAIVLLKNDNQIFPIDTTKQIKIAVIGENAVRSMTNGGGSSELKAKYEVSPLEGLRKQFPNATIEHTLGYASGPSAYGREITSTLNADSLVKAAVDLASKSDIVLFVGGLNKNHFQDCEGGDRKSMNLPFGQDEIIEQLKAVNKNIGVILISGNAVAMPWIDGVDGIMQAWYLGSEAGNAIAETVSGKNNSSGKLPFTFPVSLTDNAANTFGTIAYPGDSVNEKYLEDILVGYRWFDTKNIKPQFAFGHGLSYTTFDISNVNLAKKVYAEDETIRVIAKLSNTGKQRGSEVIQVYVGKPESKVARATKELKGFGKYDLQPNESQNIEIDIPVSKLAYFDEAGHTWIVEKGNYDVMVGNASDNIVATTTIEIK